MLRFVLRHRLGAVLSCAPIVLSGAGGCASYSAKPIEVRLEASSFVDQKEAEGLYVAVEDLSKPRDSLRFFDRDLRDYGYAPVLLLLELDRRSESVFDVRREDVHLCLQDGTRLSTADPQSVADEVSFSHFRSVVGFLFIFPGIFVASSVNEANKQIEIDYQIKALRSVRINPNMRSFRSVLFFKVPADVRDRFTMEDAFVEVKIYKGSQGGAMGRMIELPVHFGA
jgi:hypothetical protein